MSASRIKYTTQQFPIINQVLDVANNKVILTTDQLHYLYNGAIVKIFSENGEEIFDTSVTVSGNTSFTIEKIPTRNRYIFYHVLGYLPGQTGSKSPEALQRGMATPAIIQSYVTGTGGASYNIEVSLDNSHWINAASFSHTTTSGDTGFVTVTPGWTYYRANVVSIGANTTLTLMSGN